MTNKYLEKIASHTGKQALKKGLIGGAIGAGIVGAADRAFLGTKGIKGALIGAASVGVPPALAGALEGHIMDKRELAENPYLKHIQKKAGILGEAKDVLSFKKVRQAWSDRNIAKETYDLLKGEREYEKVVTPGYTRSLRGKVNLSKIQKAYTAIPEAEDRVVREGAKSVGAYAGIGAAGYGAHRLLKKKASIMSAMRKAKNVMTFKGLGSEVKAARNFKNQAADIKQNMEYHKASSPEYFASKRHVDDITALGLANSLKRDHSREAKKILARGGAFYGLGAAKVGVGAATGAYLTRRHDKQVS